MKKILTVTLILILSLLVCNAVFAEDNITVKIDGEVIDFDVQPQIIGGRTMVPMRAIFEKLGATVEWEITTQTVTSMRGETMVSLTIGVPTIIVNGSPKELDIAPCVIDGRTLVPVRAISESFNMNVNWNGTTQTVSITSENVNVEAYDKLKNILLSNGQRMEDNNYSLFFIPTDQKYAWVITYEVQDNSIALSLQYPGEVNQIALIQLYRDRSPLIYFTIEFNPEEKYYTFGEFFNSTKPFVEKSNDFPENLKPLAYQLLNGKFEFMDTIMQFKTGLSFADFGVYYEKEYGQSSNNDDSSTTLDVMTDETETSLNSTPPIQKWEAGQYKCGTDIEPGIYMTFASNGTGYYSITTDANGDDIVSNDNFKNNQIFEVARGQYLELSRAYAIKYEDAPLLAPENGILPEGRYRVGQHISAGTYKIQTTSNVSGYYSLTSDPNGDNIISNDNFDGERYVTIQNGQYLELARCQMLVP